MFNFGKKNSFCWIGVVLVVILLAGCSKNEKKSELLSLLGVDEKIVDSNQQVEDIYDALTLLKRGEAYFVKEDYPEAVMEFERFLLLHPFHRMAAFSQFKLAMSYYHQINTIDRDSAPMEKAAAAFQKVLVRFPQSLYIDEAKEKMAALRHRQAKYQFLVGYFYYKKEAYPAAISRFEKVLVQFEDDELVEKTLYFMGLSQFKVGDLAASSKIFQELQEKYPTSSYLPKMNEIKDQLEALSSAKSVKIFPSVS